MAIAPGTSGRGDGKYGYTERDQETVARSLSRHGFLLLLLDEARHAIAAAFSPGTLVILELSTDPEKGDSPLFARIEMAHPVPAASDRPNRVYDDRWLDALTAARGFLQIDVA